MSARPAILPPPGADAGEDEVAAWVDAVAADGRAEELLPLLEERHPLYRSRSGNETLRIRGWTLASFERCGLPDGALPHVLAELENGREPYLVAAAARALRGLERTSPQAVPFLLTAAHNVLLHDDAVSFERFKPTWPATYASTATEEIFATLAAMGGSARPAFDELHRLLADPHFRLGAAARSAIENALVAIGANDGAEVPASAACCGPLPTGWRGTRHLASRRRSARRLAGVVLEDQECKRLSYPDFFAAGEITVVAFFYTRCTNPERCSLTVTRLARLRRKLDTVGLDRVRIAAITYDPDHDLAPTLRTYGEDRGLTGDERTRLLRVVTGRTEFDEHFEPGVNYDGSTVNRHRIELYVVDDAGRVAASSTRLQWCDDEVIEQVRQLSRRPAGRRLAKGVRDTLAPAAALAILLVPKCPLCWMAYLSAFGIAGTWGLSASPWLVISLITLLLFHLASLYRRASLRGGRLPFAVSLLGALLVAGSYLTATLPVGYLGVACVVAGSVLNSLPEASLARWTATRPIL